MNRVLIRRLVLLSFVGVVVTAAFFGLTGGGFTTTPCKACDVPEEEWDKLPADKRAQQEEIKRRYEQALTQTPPPKDPSSGKGAIPPASTPAPSASMPAPEGILETGQAPLATSTYRINNQWFGGSDGKHVLVAAGSLTSDAEQGLVVVLVSSQDQRPGSQGVYFTPSSQDVYFTPSRAGPLRLVDAEGDRLTLLSRSGKVFAFDVAARTFSDTQLPVWPSGTFALNEAPFPAGRPYPGNMFDIVNVWQGAIDGNLVRVFAGSSLADSDQGVVIIQTVPENLWPGVSAQGGPETIRLTPEKAGALRVEAVEGDAVFLVSTTGRAFAFDLAQRSFAP